MNILNLRKKLRRISKTRRTADRRVCPHQFGTPEWESNIKANYLAWPKEDRRKEERRGRERRLPDRRKNQFHTNERSYFEKKYTRIFLTPEERVLLEDLYLSELESQGNDG
ncbi:MAG: hypothetical protein ACU84H_14030 [Gammaproteobacteria bacterium]